MINKFQNELRKIYIAELMFDPYLQMSLRNKRKLKEIKKIIESLKMQYQDAPTLERALLDEVERIKARGPRQLELAGLLFEEAFNQGILTGETYRHYRNQWFGVTDMDDATKERVEKTRMREFQDPFNLLAGEQPQL